MLLIENACHVLCNTANCQIHDVTGCLATSSVKLTNMAAAVGLSVAFLVEFLAQAFVFTT